MAFALRSVWACRAITDYRYPVRRHDRSIEIVIVHIDSMYRLLVQLVHIELDSCLISDIHHTIEIISIILFVWRYRTYQTRLSFDIRYPSHHQNHIKLIFRLSVITYTSKSTLIRYPISTAPSKSCRFDDSLVDAYSIVRIELDSHLTQLSFDIRYPSYYWIRIVFFPVYWYRYRT